MLSGTDLTSADLTNVNLTSAFMKNCNFEKAIMKDIQFGVSPDFKCGFAGYSVAMSNNGNLVAAGFDSGQV